MSLYALLAVEDGERRELSKGNSIAGYGRVDNITQGKFSLRLQNDNYVEGINVNVKVVAVTVTKTYRDEYYTETVETPVNQSTTVREPVLRRSRVPVLAAGEIRLVLRLRLRLRLRKGAVLEIF
ncbi:MAG: hypothetical protein H6559_10400 [Lewinellaceae bacterium]|nr:hypothetical protein [Lewinellaceae bacterium]